MKTHPLFAASLAGALLPFSAAHAAPLVLTNVPARQAAARLGARYGIGIVLTQNSGRHVNVALEDADDAGSRLQTVNALANALRLDFTKTIVVNRSALNAAMDGTADAAASLSADAAPVEAVDSAASVPFGATRLRTREAIALIAGADGAFAHIAGDVGGFVTLSRPTLTAAQAEQEITRQTGTTWRAVYTLAPRERVAAAFSPLLVFPDRQRDAQRQREAEEEDRREIQQQATYQGYQQAAYQAYEKGLAQRQAAFQASGAAGGSALSAQAAAGMGYYPNGSGAYGNALVNSGYGYGNGGNAGTSFPSYVIGGGL